MGDREKASLRLQFNPQIRLEFHGATITSDAGLLAFRELDDALDLTPIASDYLQESRTGRNIRHHLVPLLRQSIYSRLAGYDDTNDAERLSQDPAMRVVVGWQGSDRNAARTNTMSRFETETLTQEDNLKGLALMNPHFDPLHYLPLLERKTGALDQAAPLAGWELPEEFGVLRRLLESRMGKRGKREFVQGLRLMENFHKQEVCDGVRDALKLGAISFDAVKHLVLCRIEGRPQRLDLEMYPYLPRINVTTTSASDYMTLVAGSRR